MNLTAALKSRAAALAAGTIIFLAIFFSLAGPSWQLALYRLLQDGGCALLWLISAAGFGWMALKLLGIKPDGSLATVTCVALSLGIMSLVILALGLAGWMNPISAIAIIAIGDLTAIFAIYRRAKAWNAGKWFAEPANWNWLWLPIAAVAGVVALAACFPPGLLWGDEPNGYDVVEYHLQIPREWYEAGRIIPLHHNVFSYFPFNVEMHYLLAMNLHGGFWGPWAGMYLAQFMHVGFCAAAVWAIYAVAGGGTRGIVAGALVAAVPWTGLLAPIAYNEGGTLLFASLAIGWGLRAESWRQFVLAGIFAGFAAAAKLSVAPLLLAGVPLAVFITRPKYFAGCAAYALAAILVLSPWLIRDWKSTGNPVFPEAMSVFGQGPFTDVQAERWTQAYWPDRKYRSPLGHLDALWDEVLRDPRFGYAVFPLAVAAIAMGFRSRAVLCLAFLLAFQCVFWITFTHLQSRFMVIAIPIIALMIAQIDHRSWIVVCAAAVVVMSALSITVLTDKLQRYLDTDHNTASLIGRQNLEGFRLFDTRRLKDDQSLDLVGDAGAFWYQIPMSRLHYKTVFDVDTSDASQSIEQAWLAGMPKDATVWVDREELRRFARTYFGMNREESKEPK